MCQTIYSCIYPKKVTALLITKAMTYAYFLFDCVDFFVDFSDTIYFLYLVY